MRRPDSDFLPKRGRGDAASASYAEVATVILCALFVATAMLAQMTSLLLATTP